MWKRVKRWKVAQKGEKKFHENFSRQLGFSKDFMYDSSNWLWNYWAHRFQRFNSPNLDGNRILEIGCNVTGPIHYWGKNAILKVGIDPLLGTLYKEMATKDVNYLRSIGERIPFVDNSFGIVICYNVLDHTIDPESVLSEIFRILKNSGTLLLHVNTFSLTIKKPSHLVEYIDRKHLFHFSFSNVKYLIEKRNFKIVQFLKIHGTDPPFRKKKVCHSFLTQPQPFLERLKLKIKRFFIPLFLWTVYITAKKP